MNETLTGPLLSRKKAVVIWLGSSVALCGILEASLSLGSPWREVMLVAYPAGHTLLAYLLGKGRLFDGLPFGNRWLDVVTVLGAQWFGPLCWYYEWRRHHSTSQNQKPVPPLAVPPLDQQKGSLYQAAILAGVILLLLAWKWYISDKN